MTHIVPIQGITPVEEAKRGTGTVAGAAFSSVLQRASEELAAAQRQMDADSYALATGQTDDLHSVQINAMRATAQIELTTAVTAKVLSAYRDITNMQI